MPLTKKWWDGFAFFPATGTISFSDHRLGAGLLASPLQWLGFSAVTSYNVTLLVSFPLCAIAAHGLGLTLTKRHDAAAICGLAYGFNPFRMAHIEHLELLMAFGMPAALTALHLYRNTRHLKWAVFFALALVVQGLCTTYYVFFFGVLLLLWILWFDAWRDWRPTLAIVVACASAAGALSPIALGYWRIHRQYDFVRLLNEIVGYSADITSLATASPMLLFWGWTGSLNGPERQLFPGLTIVLLTVCGLVAALRGERVD